MSKVLVISQGMVADSFIEKIATKKISELDYIVVCNDKCNISISNNNIVFLYFDATSRYRLKKLLDSESFLVIYIVMQNQDEAKIVYENIRSFNTKVRIVALDIVSAFKNINDSYLNNIDAPELLSNRLYDFLPNVPVTAQTIGLNEGEIMEVLVPFASSYAFRHIGSLAQVKWRIAAIYRDNKLILPTNATMIRPRDRLLLVGKPQVLANVYNRIKNKSGIFPEPYGKDFYLFLDMTIDNQELFRYIKEAILFVDNFANRELIIRVVNADKLKLINKIKQFESSNIRVYISYEQDIEETIHNDLHTHDIGLFLLSSNTFANNKLYKKIYDYKKLIYMFGVESTESIKEAIVVSSDEKKTHELSTIAFYIAEAFKLKLTFSIYNPKGFFEDYEKSQELFETLSHVYNYQVDIKKEHKNPIKDIKNSKNIILVLPYNDSINLDSLLAYLNRDVDSLLFRINKHPKVLIPIEANNS